MKKSKFVLLVTRDGELSSVKSVPESEVHELGLSGGVMRLGYDAYVYTKPRRGVRVREYLSEMELQANDKK